MRMRHIVICGLSGSATYFHVISSMARFSEKKKNVIGYEMCVLIFSTNFSETYLILRSTERDMIENVYLSCKVLVFHVSLQ